MITINLSNNPNNQSIDVIGNGSSKQFWRLLDLPKRQWTKDILKLKSTVPHQRKVNLPKIVESLKFATNNLTIRYFVHFFCRSIIPWTSAKLSQTSYVLAFIFCLFVIYWREIYHYITNHIYFSHMVGYVSIWYACEAPKKAQWEVLPDCFLNLKGKKLSWIYRH